MAKKKKEKRPHQVLIVPDSVIYSRKKAKIKFVPITNKAEIKKRLRDFLAKAEIDLAWLGEFLGWYAFLLKTKIPDILKKEEIDEMTMILESFANLDDELLHLEFQLWGSVITQQIEELENNYVLPEG